MYLYQDWPLKRCWSVRYERKDVLALNTNNSNDNNNNNNNEMLM